MDYAAYETSTVYKQDTRFFEKLRYGYVNSIQRHVIHKNKI